MKDFKIEELISMLQNSGIKFIAGKWFNKFNVEIKDISSYIARSCHLFKSNDIKDVEEAFINWYGKKIGKWPEMLIVSMTKDRGPIEDKSQLPFELDEKQLIIINRILFHPEDEIMFITTGVGGSGKSTFLNIVKQLFDNDVSATTLDQLSNDFMLSQAIKHRLIASDELSKGELNNTKLKTLISKQQLSANPKGKDSYEVNTQSVLFFCCNKPPKIDITDTGILRRIVYYSRNTKIKNPDKNLNKKEYDPNELLTIARVAYSYEYLDEDDKWLDLFKEETRQNLLVNNSVYMFYKDEERTGEEYYNYETFCQRKHLKAYSEPNFEEILAFVKEDV